MALPQPPLRTRASRWFTAALIAVLLLALLLRCWDLLSLPIFIDEAIYLRWAREIWEQRTRTALFIPVTVDGKPPLFMWLAGASALLFPDPLLAGRLVSALAGTLGCLGMYLAGTGLGGRNAGFIAALQYAVVPYTLLFDRMALADGLLSVAVIWIMALSILLWSLRRRLPVAATSTALGFTLSAALWIKTPGLFAAPLPVLWWALAPRQDSSRFLPLRRLAPAYGLLAISGVLLALAPNAGKLLEKTGYFMASGDDLLNLPTALLATNFLDYLSWVQTYLPAPLWWLVLPALAWGVVRKRRHTLYLLSSWAVLAIPTMATAKILYTTRYALPSIIPLLLLVSLLGAWLLEEYAAASPTRKGPGERKVRVAGWGLALVGTSIILGPSLAFNTTLITSPSSAGLAETDRFQYVTGWPSGYGFREAVELVEQRAEEYGRDVIVLTDFFIGLPRDGMAIYLKPNPRIHHFEDGRFPWGGDGLISNYRPHQVPVFIVGNDGRDNLELLESRVPEAKRIGVFPKPGGRYSFRVYEIPLSVFTAP